jgi:tetratricopeptide (TPR) repeat protein
MDRVTTQATATRRYGRSIACHAAVVLATGVLLTFPAIAQQSGTTDSGSGHSSSSQTKQQNQQTPPAHKSAAQENPFPANVSKQAAGQQNQPSDAPAAPDTGTPDKAAPDKAAPDKAAPDKAAPDKAAPDASDQTPPATPKPGNAAAQENPFPEDVSKGAAAAAAKDNSNGNDAGGSSSSSNPAGDAPGGDTDPNADLPRDKGRRRLRKPSENDIQSGSLAGQGKAQDDIRVGRFYLGDGNYTGAYGRFSEANRMDPTNLDAIYGLAASAAGLHHTDEALTNYKLYLEIAPDGNDAKSARKAIRALSK